MKPSTRLADLYPPQKARGPVIDYYENAEGWKPTATCSLADLIDGIRGNDFAERVEEVRELLAKGQKANSDMVKKGLPAVSLSGCITGRRKAAVQEGRFEHSGLLQIDLDAKDNVGWTLDEMREILQADPRMVAVFRSPSGAGIKGVARIPKDAANHKAAFLAAEAHFRKLNLVIDASCKDPVRLCFVSHDPAAWLRMDTEEMFEPIPLELVEELDDEEEEVSTGAPRVPTHHVTPEGGIVIRGNAQRDLDAATVAEMLRAIPPRPQYAEWLKIASAVWDALGQEQGTAALQAWSPEEVAGEYAAKFEKRLMDVHAATLVMRAKENGWEPDRKTKRAIKEKVAGKKIAAMIEGGDEQTRKTIAPADVFYDAPGGKYLVKEGTSYFTYSKASPIVTGMTRHLAPNYATPADLSIAVAGAIKSRELDGAVQWVGSIAGHRQGVGKDINGLPILITSEAKPPDPLAGDCEAINAILGSAFANPVALEIFMGWVATRYRAVQAHVHMPAPMLVLAGEVNSGKSLLAWLVTQVLGGRVANPYSAWSGGTLWNDDLVGSELLLVDDCSASTDIRARRNFGAAFKEAIYPAMIQLRKRNVSAISVRPVWCAMVCCNDTPEALQIIPPLDSDLSDKVAMLHVAGVEVPIDTSTPEGRVALQNLLLEELPAFCAQLIGWEVPVELRDKRSGVLAWRDPELADAVEAHSPAKRLEDLLTTAIENRGLWGDLPREMTASEIESRLLEQGSTVREQARGLFTWHGACGSALSKLCRMGADVVERGSFDGHKRVQLYRVKP